MEFCQKLPLMSTSLGCCCCCTCRGSGCRGSGWEFLDTCREDLRGEEVVENGRGSMGGKLENYEEDKMGGKWETADTGRC